MGVGYGPGTTQLFVGGDTTDTPYFTWAQEIPLLPAGVYPFGINDSRPARPVAVLDHSALGFGAYMNIRHPQSAAAGPSS